MICTADNHFLFRSTLVDATDALVSLARALVHTNGSLVGEARSIVEPAGSLFVRFAACR